MIPPHVVEWPQVHPCWCPGAFMLVFNEENEFVYGVIAHTDVSWMYVAQTGRPPC